MYPSFLQARLTHPHQSVAGQPNYDKLLLSKTNTRTKPSGVRSAFPDEERGVHNGEFSVRPNVQDSMVFLRKLFTHQRDGGDPVNKLLSPPDGRLRKCLLVQLRRQRDLFSFGLTISHSNEWSFAKGVLASRYTIRSFQHPGCPR